MATIVKRKTKSGYSYKFQVNLKNPLTDEWTSKSKCWAVPQGLSAKQAEREAIVRATEFEEEMHKLNNAIDKNNILTPDSTFEMAAQAWLDKTNRNHSLTHFVRSEQRLRNDILPHLGKVKLNKFNPSMVQNFFNHLDKRERVVSTAYPKIDEIKLAMIKAGETYTTLIRIHKLSKPTTQKIINGGNGGQAGVALESARVFAAILKADVNKLFTIKEKRKPYEYNTNQGAKALVRAILAFCKKKRVIQDNWATRDYIDFPRKTQKEINCMDEQQVIKLYHDIANFPHIRHSTILLTFIFTGARKGEVSGLQWKDIDLRVRTITISRNLIYINSAFGVVVKEPKTEQSKRTIVIPKILVDQLARYKVWWDDLRNQFGDSWQGEDWVFVNLNGQRISPNQPSKWISQILEYAGVGHFTIHSFRHTNITIKLANNISIAEISGDAGHTRKSTTLDIYGHRVNSTRNQASELFDNIITIPQQAKN